MSMSAFDLTAFGVACFVIGWSLHGTAMRWWLKNRGVDVDTLPARKP